MKPRPLAFRKGLCLSAIFASAIGDAEALKVGLARMAADGFSAAEYYYEGPDDGLEEISRLCVENGLAVVYLAGFYLKREKLDLAAADEGARRSAVSACETMLDRARRLGAAKMLVLSGARDPLRDDRSVVQSAARSVAELTEYGERRFGGAFPQITWEFFNPAGDPYLSVGTPETAMEIARKAAGPHFGITFDTSHVAQMGLDIRRTFRAMYPAVTHLHLANSVSGHRDHPMFGDRHPPFDIPQGDLTTQDIAEFLAFGREHGLFDTIDICSAEVICRSHEQENEYYVRTLGLMRTLFPAE